MWISSGTAIIDVFLDTFGIQYALIRKLPYSIFFIILHLYRDYLSLLTERWWTLTIDKLPKKVFNSQLSDKSQLSVHDINMIFFFPLKMQFRQVYNRNAERYEFAMFPK